MLCFAENAPSLRHKTLRQWWLLRVVEVMYCYWNSVELRLSVGRCWKIVSLCHRRCLLHWPRWSAHAYAAPVRYFIISEILKQLLRLIQTTFAWRAPPPAASCSGERGDPSVAEPRRAEFSTEERLAWGYSLRYEKLGGAAPWLTHWFRVPGCQGKSGWPGIVREFRQNERFRED